MIENVPTIIPYMDFPYVGGKNESKDAFGEIIHVCDHVAFMLNHYDDRFDSFHRGTVIGFTNQFIKIKPILIEQNNRYRYQFCDFVDGEWVPKEYILRQSHRVIKVK